MSYELPKLIRFLSIREEPFGWFLPIAIAVGIWYFSMLSALTTGTGILGEQVKNRQEVVEKINSFTKELLRNEQGLDRRIVSIGIKDDGIVEQRLTVRIVDGQNTYRIWPWISLAIPSLCFIVTGMIVVGVLGYDRGAQPIWLDRSIIYLSLFALLIFGIPKAIAWIA